jgi:hypothetical protein
MTSIIENFTTIATQYVSNLSSIRDSKATITHGFRVDKQYISQLKSVLERPLPQSIEEFYLNNNVAFCASWIPPAYAAHLPMVHVEIPDPLSRYYPETNVAAHEIPKLWDFENLYPDTLASSAIPFFFCIATQGAMRCVGFDIRTTCSDPPIYFLSGVEVLEECHSKISHCFSIFLDEWMSCGFTCFDRFSLNGGFRDQNGNLDHTLPIVRDNLAVTQRLFQKMTSE